ncbi:arrestin domain-containing protein 1-like isoform X2 [Diorhabda carinulata]|uniref:arrestin domain-containing protein 1-like isoform X2 n=1 Tax=Diorhabda carinulata TaxID=1163345 RepID=UPI0025A116D5|nr:arrestin domain-containing protein 1-like isoform X2 [Diorhabda carinulata]
MTCRIDLTNPMDYGPGKTLRGQAFCQFYATETFKVIKCIFKGIEKTAWTERKSEGNKTVTCYHAGENTFLYAEALFAENGPLPPGPYVYPFAFNLPGNMASTYEGVHGSIKYYLTLIVDKGIISNYKYETEIQIRSPVNFNLIKDKLQLEPTIYKDEKVLCCCCCKSSPVTMDLLFDKEAFLIGEVAKIRMKIVNMSNTTIPQVVMFLQQKIIYKSDMGYSTYDINELATASISGVGAHGDRNYLFNFEIPSSANVPNFTGCRLFDTKVFFTAEAVIPGFHTNLRIDTETIILGHIPLDSTSSQQTDPPPYNPNEYNKSDGTNSEMIPLVNHEKSTNLPASAPTEDNNSSAPQKLDESM